MAFAKPDDVVRRLEREPEGRELVMIAEYLEEASDAARYHGREWSDATCPASVRRIVASAVARFMRNPDGYSQARGSDETLGWHDHGVIDWFTDAEAERISRAASVGRLRSFGTIEMEAGTNGHWRKQATAVYVALDGQDGSGRPFPFLDSADPIIGRYA